MRTFKSGATRDSDNTKLDFEAFLSPVALERYAEYMHKHRIQPDGTLRDGDNWQKGMPIEAYQKSLVRHLFQAWKIWRTGKAKDHDGKEIDLQDSLCAIIFNSFGYLHELRK